MILNKDADRSVTLRHSPINVNHSLEMFVWFYAN